MSGFVKRLMATGAALTLGLSSVAFANFSYDCCPPANCCPQPPCCDPCGSWCDNVNFNAAWLYWKPSGDELDYAVVRETFFPGGESDLPDVAREERHCVHGDWDSGFRIGIGANFPCRGWGADVQWTHWDNTTTSRTSAFGVDSTTTFVSVASPFFFFGSTTLDSGDEAHFQGKLKLKYDVVDVEFGKWCCFCDGVMFRPHVGFRFADIKEKFNDRLILTDGANIDGFSNLAYQYKDEFKGAGLRVGFNTDLRLCDGWSVIGKGATSAVWGNTRNKHAYFLGASDLETDFAKHGKDNCRFVRYFADLYLGLQWRTCACGCYPLTVDFAWEFNYLFNQHRPWVDNEFNDDEDASTGFKKNGNLALQGFTLNVAFDF